MNSIIEILNHWGGSFLSFAWPMLWQSSLLIAVLAAFDFTFRRKLRASVRYALWLVVLMKLCIPPTLALPTSPVWWLHKTPPPVVAKSLPHYTVTYDNTPLPQVPQTSLPVVIRPKPALNFAAWLLVASAVVSLALFVWLLVRWWQVARLVRGASAAERFSEQFNDALRLAGAPSTVSASFKNAQQRAETVLGVPGARQRSVKLKIVNGRVSPAVCGLFRPAILIPQSLAENFSDEQLRAVLLHELIHLRRRDVWVNFLQALLQIVYWWHPLVWLANARIRRVREEAVDDAVMLALRDEAESYAPTLLEVAKLALNRPLASLGLVGIMESRHALRQRIERLVDFHPPRKAGLTLVSLLGILAFTALAVPMGQGPDKVVEPANPTPAKNKIPWPDPNFEGYKNINLRAQFLVVDESELRTGVPSLANSRQPTLISTNEADDLLTELKHRGARFCNGYPDGIQQPAISGAAQSYRIGGGTNQGGTVACLTTNAGGSFSNMIAGFDIQMPATQPDWTPMGLTLRAFAQKDGTDCQLSLFFPITGNNSQQTEMMVPHGKAIVWAANPPNVLGKCQIVLLIPLENSDEYSTAKNLTHISEYSDQPNSSVSTATNLPSVLITSSIYQMRAVDFETIISDLKFNPAGSSGDPWWSASPEKFRQLTENLKTSGLHPITRPRIQTSSGIPASMYVGDGTNGLMFDCTPIVSGEAVDLAIQGKVIDTSAKTAITNQFNARTSAENFGGIVLRVEKLDGFARSNLMVVTGVQLVTNLVGGGSPVNAAAKTLRAMTFKLVHPVRQDELKKELLAAGVEIPTTTYFYTDTGMLLAHGSEEQLKRVNGLVLKLNGYSAKEIEAGNERFIKEISKIGLEDSSASPMTNLFSRHFKVDPNLFTAKMKNMENINTLGLQTNSVTILARIFFSTLGVNLDPTTPGGLGKSLFFNDGLGELFVRATAQDLDTIENALEVLYRAQTPPQIHIKARFLEVPEGTAAGLGNLLNSSNSAAGAFTGILNDANLRTVLHSLESRKDVEILAEPEVVTISGRQTQMRSTVSRQLLISQFLIASNAKDAVNNSPVLQTNQIETGPVLDVVPYVLSDGYTINLTLIPSLTELLVSSNSMPKGLPNFRVRQVVTTLNLWDGQTAIIGGLPEKDYVNGKEVADKSKASDKELLVFITATIVDPAGNRVHSDDELPFAQKSVPPQPSRPK
ncbi:MAG TPA: M56 family metallopeptidase [Verrucomicrobiae bacterium]|nr:M56 family metallopeptidase [Verrucomicrobiae bacterium]